MITIIVTIAIALAFACVVLITSRVVDADQLVQRRREPLMIGVQIVCGDCAGEGYQARRTYLDRNGYCAQCGSSNYLLASTVAAYRAQLRAQRLREASAEASQGRVIPFEAKALRGSRSKKVAV